MTHALLETAPFEVSPSSNAVLLRAHPSAGHQSSEDRLYHVGLAESADEVREAQRLRFQVFQAEYGARFVSDRLGLDVDEFDRYCQHLIVRSSDTGEVVGTYRILTPENAARIGRYYCEGEFFMTRLTRQTRRIVELGRSCVHPAHRTGSVIMLLWGGIFRFMREHGYSHLIGCASVSMRDGGATAASLWDQFSASKMVDPSLECFPKTPLSLDRISRADSAEAPALIRAYLRVGARVCGEPNWDPDFNTADFVMLLGLDSMNPRYLRHFSPENK
jgi:putative hemolysin